jgi:hypothetical protein
VAVTAWSWSRQLPVLEFWRSAHLVNDMRLLIISLAELIAKVREKVGGLVTCSVASRPDTAVVAALDRSYFGNIRRSSIES